MNIDVDSHYTPPDVFDKVKGVNNALRLEMNGYTPGTEWRHGALYNGNAGTTVPETVCVHGHRFYFEPNNWNIEGRIEAMKEAGFDRECLVSTIPRICMTPKAELAFERARNDAVAKVVESYPEYFIGVADVPHHDPDMAIEEADRAVKDLGYRAIHIEGSWLSDPLTVQNTAALSWWPFFEKVEKLGVPIFVHPVGNGRDTIQFDERIAAEQRLNRFVRRVAALFGFLIEHQIDMADCIFSGLLDHCPNLKFVWLETDAGWMPGLSNFFDSIYDTYLIYLDTGTYFPFPTSELKEPVRLRRKPSQYIKNHYSFSINYGGDLQMRTLIPMIVNTMGMAENLVIESDWPHSEGSLDLVRQIMQMDAIDEKAKLAIMGGNAEKLLKLPAAPSAYANAF